MKYPLTEAAKVAARELVKKWDGGQIQSHFPFKITGPGDFVDLSVRGILQKTGYPSALELRELERFGLVEIKTTPVSERVKYLEIALTQELRDAVENDFEVSEFYRQQGGLQMSRCVLTEKQKTLLHSIVPGLKTGTVASEWHIATGDDRITAIFGLDKDGKLWREVWAESVGYADFAAFERCGFFQQIGKDRFILFEQAIIDASERDFEETPVVSQGSPSVHYNFSDVKDSIVNIDSTLNHVHQIIETIPHGDETTARELLTLIDRLFELLKQVPPGHEEETEAIEESAKDIAEVLSKEKVNKRRLEITGEGLVKAAESLKGIVPAVLVTATEIATFIGQFRI